MPKVLVFAERMLPSTQTFIPLQVNALARYTPVYAGLIPAERNLPLVPGPILFTPDRSPLSRVRRELYRWSGLAPKFHARLAAEGPELIHAHFAEGASASVFLSRRLGLPLVLHLRGGAELLRDQDLRRTAFQLPYLAFRRQAWARASLFLCVSEFVRARAEQAGFPPEKLRVLYTGMDLRAFRPSEQPGERDPNLILYVGRLVPYKGADLLLRAVQRVQRSHPDARVVLIGDGSFRRQLERLNTELGVRASFLGELPQSGIRQWLERARVFSVPSITLADGMSEAFGNVFSEAQAMGVPVVSFRHGGIPETMIDGVTGLLADERDVEHLSAHLLRFLWDDDFWSSAQQRARALVREHFNVNVQTACLEKFYDQALAGFRPASFAQAAPAPALPVSGSEPTSTSFLGILQEWEAGR